MAEFSNDVLMKIVNKGVALTTESRTEFAKTMDSLRVGFKAGQFCELQTFDYAVGSAAALSAKKVDEAPMTDALASAVARKSKSDFVDIQPVGFSRVFDMASPALFTALVASQALDSITVVKRKAAGSKNAGEIYLRIDFTKVLLIGLKWKENEETVVETGSFIYRDLEIQYRPQRADGSLGAVIPASWKMPS